MLIVVAYDISSDHLPKVAKICENYGQRVQNSVFECNVDYSQYLLLKQKTIKNN